MSKLNVTLPELGEGGIQESQVFTIVGVFLIFSTKVVKLKKHSNKAILN